MLLPWTPISSALAHPQSQDFIHTRVKPASSHVPMANRRSVDVKELETCQQLFVYFYPYFYQPWFYQHYSCCYASILVRQATQDIRLTSSSFHKITQRFDMFSQHLHFRNRARTYTAVSFGGRETDVEAQVTSLEKSSSTTGQPPHPPARERQGKVQGETDT